MRSNTLLGFVIIVLIMLAACGGDTPKPAAKADSPQTILEAVKAAGTTKVSEVETYVGESLYEYINGGAEVYHQYDFVKVSTADFNVDGIEIVADVYEFDSSDNAYGMYSMLRPDGIETVKTGVQGFTSETSYDFIKGKYLVRLICYDGNAEAVAAMNKLAAAFAETVPGTTTMPSMFANFPEDGKIANSEKIVAESYLGQAGLDDIYTVDYDYDTEQVQMFLATDQTGEKYMKWAEAVKPDADALKSVKDLPFDSGKVLVVEDHYYGKILAGLKDGKLAGVIGYHDKLKPVVITWLTQ